MPIEHCGLWRDDQGRRRLCRGTHILGHYWLMVGLLVRVGGRALCCSLAFRLYRQKKRCPADAYRTPCQLALELLASLPWPKAPDLVRTVIADAGFADKELLRWCAANGFVAIVRGRIDAQVHDLYVQQPAKRRGRPRKYGERISLADYAADSAHFGQAITLYARRTPRAAADCLPGGAAPGQRPAAAVRDLALRRQNGCSDHEQRPGAHTARDRRAIRRPVPDRDDLP